jgi:hypothetical protein
MSRPTDCIFENILGFLLPFFLVSAGGDADLARAAITEMAEAYSVASVTELELVGRILGFSVVAMDNLRLSMNPEMSDTKVLRYRSNAAALSRAGEQCRKILEVIQANRRPSQKPMVMPRPKIVTEPQVGAPQPAPAPAPAVLEPQVVVNGLPMFPADVESMKQGARVMLAGFANRDACDASFAAVPFLPDTATMVGAAVKQALGTSRRTAAG